MSSAKHVVSFLVVMIPIFHCQAESCDQTLPGKCTLSNYTNEDNSVYPSVKASCSFCSGEQLCDYKQGCRDPGMTNWTVVNGVVNAKQTHAGSCGQNYHSVLESPWLEFNVTSCLKFRYRTYRPAALDVFLTPHNGSVITILNRSQNSEGTVTSYNWTINAGIRKIQFRAYGGGGGVPGTVEVYSTSVIPDGCELSGETATETSNPDTTAPGNSAPSAGNCRPLATTATRASTANLDTPSKSGNPLKDNMADNGPGAAVVTGAVTAVVAAIVFIVVVVIIWRRRRPKSRTGGHEKDTENEISTVKTGNVGGVATWKAEGNDGNDYTAIRKSHFALASPSPEGDYVEIDDVTSPTKIESRDADVRAHDPAKIRTRDDADIKRYDVPEVTTRDADNTPYDPAKIRNRDDADIKHYDVPKVTTRDADNTPYDLAKITTHDDDIDPYDHAEDGAPGKGRNSGGHDHKRFQLHDAPHQKPFPPEKVVDGDYSEIDGPQDITRSDVSDSYSRVQKTNKKPVSPDPKDDYSVANKKGKKPEVAEKFEQPEGDYNRIRLAGSQPVASNTPRDAPSYPYNRIGKVPSHDDIGNGGESTKAEGDQVQDDYNTLSFDEARKMSAKTTERGTTHKAYDRVQTDPYSKARVGKRNVVIDSDYDHVQK